MDVEIYHKYNYIPRRDSFNALEEYQEKIKWKPNGDKVMDVGCGDGGVTMEVVKEFLPRDYSQLYGSDKNENMVRFANKHWSDERTKFFIFDLEGDMEEQFKSGFDHVFSFYALNWVLNQKRAFINIYNMLAPGGDTLLVFIGNCAIFHAYRVLSHSSKWNRWLKNVETNISPYHDSKYPQDEVRSIMEEVGFKDLEVSNRSMTFTHSYNYFINFVKSVSAFNIPKEFMDEFAQDILESMVTKVDNENGSEEYLFKYNSIVAYGRK